MKLWVDMDSGTFFPAGVEIVTDNWTDDDWEAFGEVMTDSMRIEYADWHAEAVNESGPAIWLGYQSIKKGQ